jgi:hypothetical protein
MLVRDTRAPTVSRALAAPPAHHFFPWLLCRFVGADAPALGTVQSKLLQQSLQFTGMGGPMGVYENYDT